MPTPLLIMSDSPTGPTGLGRIARELALRIHENLSDMFDVGVYGVGGTYSRRFPFSQYEMTVREMVPTNLVPVWQDFAQGRNGILLTIMNPSWVWYLAEPEKLKDERLKAFLLAKPFSAWGYFPIDGDMIDGRLPAGLGKVMYGFDRILAYTEYGKRVIEASRPAGYPKRTVDVLPHGLDTNVFHPRGRVEARVTFVDRVAGLGLNPIKDDVFMVGVIATNSPRKDWYLVFEVCVELKRRGVKVGLWIHTDVLVKSWDIISLAEEFGMSDEAIASGRILEDDDMAWCYSAMDCVLSIGSGEGWGYVGPESLAMNVPVIHGRYAGSVDFMPQSFMVEPAAFRGDGFFSIRRPVFRASDWADAVMAAKKEDAVLPDYIKWPNAWQAWEKWLLHGVPRKRYANDHAQPDDPYGITAEMTSQSAAVDIRGNSTCVPRPIPTQAEANAIVEKI